MFKKLNFSSQYFKGIISLFKGFLGAQTIGFLGVFIVAKLYGAAEFGEFSKFMSLVSILAVFFSLRLESALVLSFKKEHTDTLFSSIIYIIITLSTLSSIIIYFFPDVFFTKVNLAKTIFFTAIFGAFLKSLENTYRLYLIKGKQFKDLANSKILFSFLRYVLQISLFFMMLQNGLIIGYLIAFSILIFYLYKKATVHFKSVSIQAIKTHILENKNLVTFGLLSDNLNTIILNLIPLLGGMYFNDIIIGWYFLAITFLSIPVSFVHASFSKIFFIKTSELLKKNKKEFYTFIKKSTVTLSLISIFPLLFFLFLSNYFITFFFQESWGLTATYIQILAFLFFVRAIYNPISHLEEVLKKNHLGFYFNLFLLTVYLVAIYYGKQENNFLLLLKIIAYGSSVGYIFMIFSYLIIAKKVSKTTK